MNWLLNIFDSIKWKIEDAVWAIQDKYTLWKELKAVDKELELDQAEGIAGAWQEEEIKPKKKKAKKKSAKKAKKSV
jgi:hypothetical protein